MDDELSSEIGELGEFGGTDRYQVLERIGRGGMGVVYAAFDRLTRTRIGLKLLYEHAPESLARFKREFRSIQDIQHSNLISLGELREERGFWFFTMELLTGQSFRAFVRPPPVPAPARDAIQPTIMVPQRALPSGLIGTEVRTVGKDELPRSSRRWFHEDRLRHALIQVVRGLSMLHQAHKVHRDIKPSNIIVEPDGRAVILDFGIAFDVREGDRLSGDRVIGTGVYMAPEQLDPAACSPASDYYSVGVLLYEALTGRRPFEGKNAIDVLHRKRAALPPPPSEFVPGVPADLDELCMELLAIDPAARPRADEILRRLGDIQPLPRLDIERAVPESAFVGRERELAALIEAAQAPVHGQTIFISGDSGMGKSALLGRFRQLTLDALLLPGRCYERESVPFKGIDGVIDVLAHHLRALPAAEREPLIPRDAMLMVQLFPDLEPVVRGSAEAGHETPAVHRGDDSIDSYDFRQRAFSALRELLARLGSKRPVVIAIDDMQWADLDTWLLLGHLTRPPDPPPMVLVLLIRPPKDIDAAGFDKLIDGPVRVFELAPLETADACDLAARLMRAEGREDDALAHLIASESEGHPLFIEQLICHVLESDAGALRATRLEDALRSRIGRLSCPARALLEIIAIAGIPSGNGIIAAAAELEFDVYQRLIAELRAARLVRTTGMEPRDTVEHEHDRIREAVLAGLAVAERQLVHLCLVHALEATGMSERVPELAVQHLEAAGKHERAAVYALQAAERAMDAMAFERAAGLYRTAVEHGSHSGVDRQRLLLRLAKALVDSGHAYQAAQVYLEAAAAGDQATRLDCMRRAAEHLLSTGHVRRGFEVLRAALSELGVSVPATRGQALRSLLLHRALLRIHGLRWRERSGPERGRSKLFELEIDIYRSAGRALSMIDNVRGADFQARALFHALRLGEPARIAKSLAFEAGYAGSGGSAGRARGRRLLEEARAMAERIGDLHLQAWLCTTGGMLDFFIGEYRRANTALAEAERRYARLGVISWERNSNRIFRLLALRFSGDFKRLRVLHDQYVRDAEERGDLYTSSMIRRSCGIVWLVAGDIEGARAELGRAVWFPSSGGTVLHDWYEVRARAEISLYEGTAGEVLSDVERIIERLRRAILMRVTSIRVDAMALMGRLLLAGAHPMARARSRVELSRVRCIMEQLDGEQVLSAQAHAAVLRAGLMGGSRDPGRCVICLRGVEALAQRSGMRWLRESARYARGSLIGGSRGAALMAGAVAWMRSEDIEEPARMVAYALPGVRL